MSKFAVNKNNCVSLIFRSPEARRMRNDGDVLELARGGGRHLTAEEGCCRVSMNMKTGPVVQLWLKLVAAP